MEIVNLLGLGFGFGFGLETPSGGVSGSSSSVFTSVTSNSTPSPTAARAYRGSIRMTVADEIDCNPEIANFIGGFVPASRVRIPVPSAIRSRRRLNSGFGPRQPRSIGPEGTDSQHSVVPV